jgi:hypothetical protein
MALAGIQDIGSLTQVVFRLAVGSGAARRTDAERRGEV